MKTPLSVRVREAVAFDANDLKPHDDFKWAESCFGDGGVISLVKGSQIEHARLAPFLEVLGECVDALEAEKCKCVYKPFSHQYRFMCKRCESLTKLQELLDEK